MRFCFLAIKEGGYESPSGSVKAVFVQRRRHNEYAYA